MGIAVLSRSSLYKFQRTTLEGMVNAETTRWVIEGEMQLRGKLAGRGDGAKLHTTRLDKW